MTDTANAVRTAAVSTTLSVLAGLTGGPMVGALTGFITGLPLPLIAATSLATMIWLDPMTGIWLAITAAAATAGFILGVLRKPHRALYRKTGLTATGQDTGHLEDLLAQASPREHALLAALIAASNPGSPVALPAPSARSQQAR
jgi:hypothetical protein